MSSWSKGDIAVAKITMDHCQCGKCLGDGHRIEKGKMYRVRLVCAGNPNLYFGETLWFGDTIEVDGGTGRVVWDHIHFEKLVPANEDIFKLAAPSNPAKLKELT